MTVLLFNGKSCNIVVVCETSVEVDLASWVKDSILKVEAVSLEVPLIQRRVNMYQ